MAEVGRRLFWVPASWNQVVRVKGGREHHRGVLGLKKVPPGHWGGVLYKEYPSVAKEVGHFEEENLLLGLQREFEKLQSVAANRKKDHASSSRDVKSLGQGEWFLGQHDGAARKHQQRALSLKAGGSAPRHWKGQDGVIGHKKDALKVPYLHLLSRAASADLWPLSSSLQSFSTAGMNSWISDSTETVVGAVVHPTQHGFLTVAFKVCTIAPFMSYGLSASTRGLFSAAGHQTSFSRVYSTTNGAGRNGSLKQPLFRSPTAYYDILGVTGSATQSQIKTAYYRQSFRYHPDRNNGDQAAALRFTEINEAYLILGSVTLRKKYDRGTLSQEDVRAAGKPTGKVAGSTTSKRTESTSSSRYTPTKPIFDFDEFYRAHYGEQLERERYMRWRREEVQRQKKGVGKRWQMKRISEVAVLMLLCSAAFIFFSVK